MRNLAVSVVRFFKEFVDSVVVSVNQSEGKNKEKSPGKGQEPDSKTKNESPKEAEAKAAQTAKAEGPAKIEEEACREEVEALQRSVGEGEPKKATTDVMLFPAEHNVDALLFGRSSVIPCSLDINSLDTPMTVSVTPEGNFSCKLNKESFANLQGTSVNPAEKSPPLVGKNLPISPQSNSSTTPMKEEDGSIKEDGGKEEAPAEADKEGNYVCHYCDAKFRIRGYLTRHIKKHAIRKAYHCPFFNPDAPPELRCHNSGGFSRRDTYKTHLKARHFIYPKGVKPQDRNRSSGHCSQCGQFFENTDQWVEQHIETGECKGLPKGYLKNIKSERKSGRLRMIKTSNGHSRFISTAQSVVEPKVLLNRDALEAMAIVAQNTNRSDILSKYGNNKIMMSSDNFKGEPKPKRKYARRKVLSSKEGVKKDYDSPMQFSSMEGTPFESCGMSSSGSNCASEYMDDETALNEISSSLNPSPPDHQVLELVPTNSSASSQEYHPLMVNKNEPPIKQAIGLSNYPAAVKFNDPFSVPLDMEQCSFFDGTYITDFHSNAAMLADPHTQNNCNNIAINETLRNEMDPIAQAENHIRENEQYMNFYNFTHGHVNTDSHATA